MIRKETMMKALSKEAIDKIAEKGEKVFQLHQKKLEEDHYGKAVAIDWEQGRIVAVADTIDGVAEEAKRRHPEKVFYVKKIGEDVFIF